MGILVDDSKWRGEKSPRRGWIYTGWRQCGDVYIKGVIERAPRYLRCLKAGCNRLVTHGQVSMGGCACGNRKLAPALSLSYIEAILLKIGWFPLADWERAEVKPISKLMSVRQFVYAHLG